MKRRPITNVALAKLTAEAISAGLSPQRLQNRARTDPPVRRWNPSVWLRA
jgi:hypothetical protein